MPELDILFIVRGSIEVLLSNLSHTTIIPRQKMHLTARYAQYYLSQRQRDGFSSKLCLVTKNALRCLAFLVCTLQTKDRTVHCD